MIADRIGAFLRVATVPAGGAVSNVRELHRAFCSWSGTRPALGEFLRALVAAGVDVEPIGGEAWAHGVRFSEDGLDLLCV